MSDGSARNARYVFGAMVACILGSSILSCTGRSAASVDREVVLMMLQRISLDSLCGCEHVVIDPVVRRSPRIVVYPPTDAPVAFRLTAADLSEVRGAQTVDTLAIGRWPYFEHGIQDTVAVGVFVVDTVATPSDDQRSLAVFVIARGRPGETWSWNAWRWKGMWVGGPLVLTFSP